MIQITRSGTSLVRDAAWEAQKAAFKERHLARLSNFVEPSLLGTMKAMLDAGTFHHADHTAQDDNRKCFVLATELRLELNDPLGKLLRFITCRTDLYQAIGELIDADDAIHGFFGRCFKRLPEHYDGWHQDSIEGRLVGLSLGLQPEPFVGGEFQMTNSKTGVTTTFPPPSFGEATIFDISPHLIHRVRRVKTETPRISWAGWFTKDRQSGIFYDLISDKTPLTSSMSPSHPKRSRAKAPA